MLNGYFACTHYMDIRYKLESISIFEINTVLMVEVIVLDRVTLAKKFM